MKKNLIILIAFVLTLAGCEFNIKVRSFGNDNVKVAFNAEDNTLSVYYSKDSVDIPVVNISDLGYRIKGDTTAFVLEKAVKSKMVLDSYKMISGKRSSIDKVAFESVFTFRSGAGTRMDLIVRIYHDGVAFRYTFPECDNLVLTESTTTYNIPLGIKRWTQKWHESYEDFYPLNTDGTGNNRRGDWGYPALFEVSDSVFMLLTEADITRENCGSWLNNQTDRTRYTIRMQEDELNCSKGWKSTWNVLIVGTLADVVESTLVTDVSTPCAIEDTSWIEPGLVSWIYWAYNHGSKDFQIVKKYIDFAVDMNLPYVLIDWEWDEMANGGNLDDAIAYAKEKGIKPLLWYNSSTAWLGPGPLYRLNSKENREKEFAKLQQMGVKGIKVDFFQKDSLTTMNYFIDILEDAAKYELMVNFHGATIPRGFQRTYPNMVSVEGVYGAEWYNNAPVLTNRAAAHNCTLPFTRNVVGPMDYTPCTFTDSQFPHITTDAHELALLVVFESTLQHLADRPEGYMEQSDDVRNFISSLPTVWDDTKLLAGYPGEYVVMARRKGGKWYIAGLNGSDEEKSITFNLPAEISTTILFADTQAEYEQENCMIDKVDFSAAANSSVEILCKPRGGFILTN